MYFKNRQLQSFRSKDTLRINFERSVSIAFLNKLQSHRILKECENISLTPLFYKIYTKVEVEADSHTKFLEKILTKIIFLFKREKHIIFRYSKHRGLSLILVTTHLIHSQVSTEHLLCARHGIGLQKIFTQVLQHYSR